MISRTWTSLGPETRYCGFWLGLSPSHMGSSPKLGIGWVQAPVHGLESQSVLNGFSWRPRRDGDKVRKGLKSGLGPKEVPGIPEPGILRKMLCCCLLICDWQVNSECLCTSNSRSRTELYCFVWLWGFFSYIFFCLFLFISALFLLLTSKDCFCSPPSDPYKCWPFIPNL